MATSLIGVVITLGVFLIKILVFRNRGGQRNGAEPTVYFSTHAGGHDGLGQSGGG
jgi:hypothetical protein